MDSQASLEEELATARKQADIARINREEKDGKISHQAAARQRIEAEVNEEKEKHAAILKNEQDKLNAMQAALDKGRADQVANLKKANDANNDLNSPQAQKDEARHDTIKTQMSGLSATQKEVEEQFNDEKKRLEEIASGKGLRDLQTPVGGGMTMTTTVAQQQAAAEYELSKLGDRKFAAGSGKKAGNYSMNELSATLDTLGKESAQLEALKKQREDNLKLAEKDASVNSKSNETLTKQIDELQTKIAQQRAMFPQIEAAHAEAAEDKEDKEDKENKPRGRFKNPPVNDLQRIGGGYIRGEAIGSKSSSTAGQISSAVGELKSIHKTIRKFGGTPHKPGSRGVHF